MNPQQESDFNGIKNAIFPLQNGLVEVQNKIIALEKRIKILEELDLQVKTLSDARLRQIAFNTSVTNDLNKLKEKPAEKVIEKIAEKPIEKKSIWDIWS